MNIILYIAIFSIGIVFGSFFTLAVYRIPRKEDITHVRSHCTTCNHRLNFIDLIPVFSYLFLRGKCRYCGDKIRIRYFLLEILSGIVFLALAFSRGLSYDMSIISFIELALIYLMIAGTFIIAGIDKEKFEIPNGLILYELIIGVLYVIFRGAIGESIITNIVGFIALPVLLLIINILMHKLLKNENKLPFGMGDIKYIAVLGLFAGFGIQLLTILLALLLTGVEILILLIRKKDVTQIPFGFFLTIAFNILLIVAPYIVNIVESIELMM